MMAEKKYYILCLEDNKLVEIDDFDDIKDVEAFKEKIKQKKLEEKQKQVEEEKEMARLIYEENERQQAMYNGKIAYLLEKIKKDEEAREAEKNKPFFEKLKSEILNFIEVLNYESRRRR